MDVDADYGQASRVDESWVLPAVTEFGGFPEVTADGDIIYTFEDMSIHIPSGTGDGAKHAPWKLDGTMRIRTKTHEGQ